MKKIQLKIKDMDCASCVVHIEDALKTQDGIKNARLNFAIEEGEIEFDEKKISQEKILSLIKKTGYKAEIIEAISHKPEAINPHNTGHGHHAADEGMKKTKQRLIKFVLSAVLTILILLFSFVFELKQEKTIMLVLAIGIIYAGREFFLIGYPNLFHVRPGMDTLVALGITAAFLFSAYSTLFQPEAKEYFLDVGLISTFILFGRYLEARAKGKAGEAIKKLLELSAKVAHKVEKDGSIKDIPIDQVKKGDILLVKPGEKIPTDGVIFEGQANIDESMITGESIPVFKTKNDKVIGATINGNQSFKMKAVKIGAETALAQIVKMVNEAQLSKAPIQKLVDKISKYFVWAVISIAIIVFVAWSFYSNDYSLALVITVTVLIIACPCALGLATPISIVVGTGRGASQGILIKNSESLEKMHKITMIVFDKTGTITKGKPEVQEWVSLWQDTESELGAALALENESEHPLARAIIDWFEKEKKEYKKQELKNIKAYAGKGIEGKTGDKIYRAGSIKYLATAGAKTSSDKIKEYQNKGFTLIGFAKDDKILGFFAVQDAVKDSSKKAVETLHKMKIKTMMLTGDNEKVAKKIASEVGIDNFQAEVLPEEKVEQIKKLQKEGEFVAMVGDGINDAPALAQADVGIAIGTGTDVAVETGDVVLVKGDLNKAAESILLSEKTLKNIKQNLFWAFIYNTVGIPIAAFGLLNPAISAAAMSMSSVSVVLNALRLRK